MILDYSDLDIVARTIMGEAEGEPYEGKVAVAAVIYNRARQPGWWGRTVKDVCWTSKQFSCWNDRDPRRNLMGDWDFANPIFRECMKAAIEAVDRDPTEGADHYFAHGVVLPSWAVGKPTKEINGHSFVRIYP